MEQQSTTRHRPPSLVDVGLMPELLRQHSGTTNLTKDNSTIITPDDGNNQNAAAADDGFGEFASFATEKETTEADEDEFGEFQ